jgi:pimeloyl-ACP methyl ester carboxylesterase
LIANGITRPFIVVGIYNDPPNRYAEFFPQQTSKYMDTSYVSKLKKTLWNGELRADYYLEWLTKVLIPFVESSYNVSHKSADRFLIGSSMGGLISLYGLTQKPKSFGGAACLSIHTPMINFQMTGDDAMNKLVLPFNTYLGKKLPSPKKKKIYIDRGTETLDANYGPYHDVLLNTLQSCGYQTGPNFLPLVWDKTAHDEVSWANRLAVPIKFLLIKDK